jgi:hypothetical protein
MDNKQDRQFYWEVKQFMGKTPNLASQENQNSPSLVENIRNVLNKNELYRPSSFNPSINSPNTINQAIGAMEQSKKLGASNSAEHSNNIYGNAFANPPKNLNEDNVRWNPKEHTEEENKAWKIQLAAERVAREKADYEKLRKYRKENPQAYREQQEKEHNAKESARQKFEASKAGNKAVNNSGNNPKIDDTNKAAYDAAKELMYQIQNRDAIKKAGGQINPNAVETAAQKARDANEKVNKLNAEAKKSKDSAQRISPAYWVTHDDFEKATGEKYDPRNAKHRQLFFDLNSSGESTVSPTAGVGQGPAYDSLAYHTMRRRPKEIPQFGTPGARYDVVDGELANTTPKSRAKAQWDADDAAALERIDAEAAKRDAEIRAEAKRIVDAEQKVDYFKKFADKKTEDENKEKDARQEYIDQIAATLRKDGSRTIVEPGREERGLGIDVEHGQHPIYPEGQEDSAYAKPREAPGSAVSDAVNALISGAGKSAIEKGKELGSTMKQSLMQTVPMQGQPAGGADPDIERGQHPIYPEGQSDSGYVRPREAPGSAVSDIINNLIKSVGDSGKTVADELQRLMKLNAAQTTPNVIKDKLYGDSAIRGAGFDEQEKSPSTLTYDTYWGNLPDPNIHDIDLGDVKVNSTVSTGGMNQPMDLADFKDEEEEKVPQSSTDFVKDIVKPLKDAGEEQSAQEKINDILKNLGTPSSKKTSKRVKRKRKGTTGLAMVGEGVVVPPPSFDPFFSRKELRTDLIGNPNPVPTFTGIGKGVANTVMNPVDSAKSAANMAKKGVSAVKYAVKNPIPAATTVGKTGLQIGGAIVLPYIAGEGARQVAELGTNLVGLDPATEMHEVPNLSKEIQSVADWSAMAGAGQLYMNALRGAPLLSGVGTQLVAGALGGALVPVFAHGGFKAGEALRDVSTPEMLGLEVTDKTGKLRPKTYAETGEDVVNYYVGDSETDKNKEWRSRRGMPNQGKPEPTVYPTVAELQKRTKEEKERKMIESGQLRRDIPSPLQSNTWDHANKSPSGPPVRAPRI